MNEKIKKLLKDVGYIRKVLDIVINKSGTASNEFVKENINEVYTQLLCLWFELNELAKETEQ